MREDVARALREMPAELSRAVIDATKTLYAPLQEARPFRDLTVTRDVHYGLHERHRLDLFSTGGDAAKPVFVFVHGGGFVGGDKSDPSGAFPYYENVGVWAARSGFVGATITYRRAPDHQWPAGAEDVGSAIRWLRTNVGKHGGDPDAIVLMGQSAGATHVAGYVGMEALHAAPGGGIAGAIVFSGVYDFVLFDQHDLTVPYLGDRRRAAQANALPGLAATELPLLFANSEYDPPPFHEQTRALFEARYARLERTPDYLYLPGHNHISQVANLGSTAQDAVVSERLADFARRAVDSAASRSSVV